MTWIPAATGCISHSASDDTNLLSINKTQGYMYQRLRITSGRNSVVDIGAFASCYVLQLYLISVEGTDNGMFKRKLAN
jgi:hypothetical protein